MGVVGAGSEAEFRTILDTLFCTCFPESQTREARLRREVFLRCELKGRPRVEIARSLDLDLRDVDEILEKIHRDLAVIRMLGLGVLDGVENPPSGCRCCGAAPEQSRHRQDAQVQHSAGLS